LLIIHPKVGIFAAASASAPLNSVVDTGTTAKVLLPARTRSTSTELFVNRSSSLSLTTILRP